MNQLVYLFGVLYKFNNHLLATRKRRPTPRMTCFRMKKVTEQDTFMQNRIKTLLFFCIMIVLVWIVTELIAIIGYSISNHTLFSKNEIKHKIKANIRSGENLLTVEGHSDLWWDNFVEVIHPYFGFVPDPNRNGKTPISDFGFVSGKDTNPIMKRSRDKTIIGVFGGSFAEGTYRSANALLKECLESTNKEIIILNFSTGGYKQPQQLLILTYLLGLGAEFDVIINIDGFNEVALPPAENIPNKVYPFYPRKWHVRTSNTINLVTIKQLGYIELLKEKKMDWARLFNSYKLYRSPTLCLLWEYRDQALNRDIYTMRQVIEQNKKINNSNFELTKQSMVFLRQEGVPKKIVSALKPLKYQTFGRANELLEAIEQRIGKKQTGRYQNQIFNSAQSEDSPYYVTHGPQYSYETDDQLYFDLVSVWQQCSLQMKALCDANNIQYYHFLQPNQYMEGSKPMTEKEIKIALRDDHPYKPAVIKGYPLLIEAGEQLLNKGIIFTDLTMLFLHNSDILYIDDCCHLNRKGYEIIAHRICEVIR